MIEIKVSDFLEQLCQTQSSAPTIQVLTGSLHRTVYTTGPFRKARGRASLENKFPTSFGYA